MRYLLLICHDEAAAASAAARVDAATIAWVAEMAARGVRQQGAPLRPTSDATTIRVRGGEVLLSDGPFAETKEQIAGYVLIECRDLDEAIEVAAKHPGATSGTIEVRPVREG